MKALYAVVLAVTICVLAAALEGACAGRNVKAFFSTLKFPRYSAPLWVWSIIGGVYYLSFGFVTYRLLRLDGSMLRNAALALVLLEIVTPSPTIIFRARNVGLFLWGVCFPVMDISLRSGLFS